MSIFLWMQTKCDASLDFWFWYKCFLTKMQMQFLMMQMFHAGMEMQSLFMMVLVHIFIPWCKCLFVGIPWCEWPLVGMPWCKCFDANNLFKNSLFFQIEASLEPKTKIFSNLDLLFPEKSFFFWFKTPKNWWSLLEDFWMGIDSESDDLAQKIYFHDLVEQRGGTFPRPFFGKKMSSLKIKHLRKI